MLGVKADSGLRVLIRPYDLHLEKDKMQKELFVMSKLKRSPNTLRFLEIYTNETAKTINLVIHRRGSGNCEGCGYSDLLHKSLLPPTLSPLISLSI